MINLAPGKGLGNVQRPYLALTLGYIRFGSTLSPITGIIGQETLSLFSEEPVGHIESTERIPEIESIEIIEVDPEAGIYAITGVVSWDVVSEEPDDIISELPDEVIGEIPKDIIGDEVSDVESDEPDDITSEEP